MAIEFVEPQEAKKIRKVWVKAVLENGGVTIKTHYEDGTEVRGGNLFHIRQNGRFIRNYNVNHDLGFDLDEHGRIKEGD